MSDTWAATLLLFVALLGLFIGAASAVRTERRRAAQLHLELLAAIGRATETGQSIERKLATVRRAQARRGAL